jgi:hypothetical protein
MQYSFLTKEPVANALPQVRLQEVQKKAGRKCRLKGSGDTK